MLSIHIESTRKGEEVFLQKKSMFLPRPSNLTVVPCEAGTLINLALGCL
jgi:hypothetical protein